MSENFWYDGKCVVEKGTFASDQFTKTKFPKFKGILEEGDHVIALTNKGSYRITSKEGITTHHDYLLSEDVTNKFEHRPGAFACHEYDGLGCHTQLYKISESALGECKVFQSNE